MMTCLLDPTGCFAKGFSALVPDWLEPLLPYWWIVALVAGIGLAYRLAGVPGVAAFAGALGYILGRRSVQDEAHEHVAGKDAAPPVPKPKRPTIIKRK